MLAIQSPEHKIIILITYAHQINDFRNSLTDCFVSVEIFESNDRKIVAICVHLSEEFLSD